MPAFHFCCMESIKKWINAGCKYYDGVALYATLPECMPTLLANLQQGKNAVRHEKLKYELKKALRSDQAPPPTPLPSRGDKMPAMIPSPPAEPPAQDVKEKLLFHQLPAELRPVLKEANALFAEKCMLKVALNELAPEMESEALDLCLQIYNLTKHNALCWQKIDYWREHRNLPPLAVPKHSTMGGAQLVKKQQNLFSSISRLKKRLNDNRSLIAITDGLKAVAKLQRAIAKQEGNLMKQEDELLHITQLIEAKA